MTLSASEVPVGRAHVRGACALVAVLALSACTIQRDTMLDRDGAVDAASDAALVDGAREAEVDAAADGGFRCEPGRRGCFGSTLYECGADGASRDELETCAAGCDPTLGCVPCTPGARRCDGTISEVCQADGSGWSFARDCGEWSTTCGSSGFCDDRCGAAEASRSNIGCEYWSLPLPNSEELDVRTFDFRIVVSNPSIRTATISVTRAGRLVETERVVPGGVIELALPWIGEVSAAIGGDDWTSHVVAQGAYRVTSTEPVVVAQFNPFHYAVGGARSFTNDASLLYPTHVLTGHYVGTSYVPFSRTSVDAGTSGKLPGYLTLVGTDPGTTTVDVTLAGRLAADPGGRWPARMAGETVHFTLARGEVALLVTPPPPACDATRPGHRVDGDGFAFCREVDYDLTGSTIESDRPVAAFGGHVCANLPFDVGACDHLETQLAPVETWGRQFETVPLRDVGDARVAGVPNVLRITTASDGNEITVTPPVDGRGTFALDRGEFVEFSFTDAVSVRGAAPIQVAQMMVGQNVLTPPLERGDPSLTILVPSEQFRTEYVFGSPSSYAPITRGQSYLLVSREPDEAISIDGAPLDATWQRIGERELAVVEVAAGTHRMRALTPFGVIAYGLGEYTSYAYPAGLDLRLRPD